MGSVSPRCTNALFRAHFASRRISYLPSDIADQYLPDTFALPPNTALPIALFLHILHFLVRAPLFLEPRTRRRRGLGKNVDADWDDVFKTPEEISRGNLERFERVQENAGGRRGVVSASGVSLFPIHMNGIWLMSNVA